VPQRGYRYGLSCVAIAVLAFAMISQASAATRYSLSLSVPQSKRAAQAPRLVLTPSIVKPGHDVTVRVPGQRKACTVTADQSHHKRRIGTIAPQASISFSPKVKSGGVTVSVTCGSKVLLSAPVWVATAHRGLTILGHQTKAGRAGGGLIAKSNRERQRQGRSRTRSGDRRASVVATVADARSSIVSIAKSQVGIAETPAKSGCNPYTGFWGDGTGGCGAGLRKNAWCADFVAWVWRKAGVSFTYGFSGSDINAWSASFYFWGLATGNWHPLSSGYQPQPGDAVVYGNLTEATGPGHVGIYVSGAASAPNTVDGNWSYPTSNPQVYEQSKTPNTGVAGGVLQGYVSVPSTTSAGGTTGGSTPPPTTTSTPSGPTLPPGTYSETVGSVAHTWSNYQTAGGTAGPSLAANQTVGITCRIQGFTVSDGDNWWYEIGSSPWNNQYYVSADAFYNNGATSGSLSNTPFYDQKVALCPTSAGGSSGGSSGGSGGGSTATTTTTPPQNNPPPTWNETVGSVANTWTNWMNAGGNEGPQIANHQTVAISCRLNGFTVADGNTWWYRIASSPWNNSYYVSADAFYNNGATSGSLHGTPFFDPAVATC
jgi:hypothetical protein